MFLGRAMLATVAFFGALAAVMFICAGRVDLPMLWVYNVEMIVLCLLALALIQRRTPDLIIERWHPGEGEQDRIFKKVSIPLFVAVYAVAGLECRPVPLVQQRASRDSNRGSSSGCRRIRDPNMVHARKPLLFLGGAGSEGSRAAFD